MVEPRFLKRGGLVVDTSAGSIQFGIPPETIKDSLISGFEVPQFFVVPDGISLAEVEFPCYYNFFIKNRKTRLIVNRKTVDVLKETLYGPVDMDATSEWGGGPNSGSVPDLKSETVGFTKITRPDMEVTAESMVDYIFFEDGKAVISDQVYIIATDSDDYIIYDNNIEILHVPCEIPFPTIKHVIADKGFEPPPFGVTCLGSSTGFDPKGVTSGVIIWVNHQGIMVDPPANCSQLLDSEGISPSCIGSVVLTHCHADHDSGLFQQLIRERKLSVITTNTIITSFLRKYSSVSGMSISFIKTLFSFHPVVLGQDFPLYGATLRFNYSLHTVPCISMEVRFCSKSLFYTGDHCNDPTFINGLYEQGVISKGRRDFLLNFNWDHDLILHEAGPKPIHTPIENLSKLSSDIKSRLLVYHSPLQPILDNGLNPLKAGVRNTVQIHVEGTTLLYSSRMLGTLNQIDLLSDELTFLQAKQFLEMAQIDHYNEGEVILLSGCKGDRFYIILSGVVVVENNNGDIIKVYQHHDFFGETSILTGNICSASCVAKTQVTTCSLSKQDFLYLFKNSHVPQRLITLAKLRSLNIWNTIEQNALFSDMTSGQKTYLEGMCVAKNIKKGQILWNYNDLASRAILIKNGALLLTEFIDDGNDYHPGWKSMKYEEWKKIREASLNEDNNNNNNNNNNNGGGGNDVIVNHPISFPIKNTNEKEGESRQLTQKVYQNVERKAFDVKRTQTQLSVSYLQSLKYSISGNLSSGLFGIRQFTNQKGSNRIHSLLSNGALILELHALYPEPKRHKTQLIALEDSTVFTFPYENVKNFMEIYPSTLIHLLDHPTYVDANEDQICCRIEKTLESFNLFSDNLNADQLEILTHIMYVECIPASIIFALFYYLIDYYTECDNVLLRFVVSGNCQLLRENNNVKSLLKYTTGKWFTTFEQDSVPSKVIGLFTHSDCVFITLLTSVFENFLDAYNLTDLKVVLQEKFQIFTE